jgi:hypothetical protein
MTAGTLKQLKETYHTFHNRRFASEMELHEWLNPGEAYVGPTCMLGVTHRVAGISRAKVVDVLSRRGKFFFNNADVPNVEPWFLVMAGTTSWFDKPEFILLAVSEEKYLMVKPVNGAYGANEIAWMIRPVAGPNGAKAKVGNFGKIDLERLPLGPDDRELIELAIATMGWTLK